MIGQALPQRLLWRGDTLPADAGCIALPAEVETGTGRGRRGARSRTPAAAAVAAGRLRPRRLARLHARGQAHHRRRAGLRHRRPPAGRALVRRRRAGGVVAAGLAGGAAGGAEMGRHLDLRRHRSRPAARQRRAARRHQRRAELPYRQQLQPRAAALCRPDVPAHGDGRRRERHRELRHGARGDAQAPSRPAAAALPTFLLRPPARARAGRRHDDPSSDARGQGRPADRAPVALPGEERPEARRRRRSTRRARRRCRPSRPS